MMLYQRDCIGGFDDQENCIAWSDWMLMDEIFWQKAVEYGNNFPPIIQNEFMWVPVILSGPYETAQQAWDAINSEE